MKFKYLFLIMLCLSSYRVSCQARANKSKYRVVAVQNGTTHIKSFSNEVAATIASKYYFPNAFSPNGDGLNDTFGVLGVGIEEYELLIFNRTGELLFESTDVQVAWDGTYMNNKVPAGTYVYKVKMKGKRSGGKFDNFSTRTGTVTIVN
jgi:gliding motility-associated-like protein